MQRIIPGIPKANTHTHTKKIPPMLYYIEASLFLLAKFRQKAKLNIKNTYTSYLVYSHIWLNLAKDDHHFFYIFPWMMATLATNKNF